MNFLSATTSKWCFSAVLACWIALNNVQAAMLSTESAVQSHTQKRLYIERVTHRQDVQQLLQEHGIDPVTIDRRLASMTDEEVAELSNRFDQLPAGGDAGVAVTVLIILALLEILGITDLFTFL